MPGAAVEAKMEGCAMLPAKLIKVADKISNIGARIVPNPDQAQRSDLAAYAIWAEKVVAGCRGVNARLDVEFDETVKTARRLF